MIFITINTVLEFGCFLVALLCLYNDKATAWRLFIPFLLLTCLVEAAGIYIREIKRVPNFAVYNVYILFENGFTSYFFYYLYKDYGYKIKWWLVWLGFFSAMYVTELVYNNFSNFVSVTASVMSVAFVLVSLFFYYVKLKDEYFEPLLFSPPFWWISGTLFFYFGSTVCNNFWNYLATYEITAFNYSIRYIIFNLLNIIMYTFWSYAFICRYRRKKLSPSLG